MADDKKTVELEIVANAESASGVLDKIARKAAEIGKTDAKFGKIAEKHQKEKAKLDQKLNNPRKQKKAEDNVKAATRHEKQKLRLYESQTKELQKHYSLMQKIANASGGKGKGKGPKGPGPSASGGGGGSMALLAANIGTAVAGAVVAGVGLAVGAVSRQISAGYDTYSSYAMQLPSLSGMDTSLGRQRGLDRAAQRYGYGPEDTLQQSSAAALATGQVGAVTQAQRLSRGTSMSANELIGTMKTLTQAGTGFGGGAGVQGRKELEKVISLGFESGIDKARIPEFVKGVEKVVQLQAGRQGGTVGAGGYAEVLQAMGATGAAGLQGDRGAAVFQRLNEAIVKPGGGEAGQALMLQAFGFGKPGGGSTYYDALKRQERGADKDNVADLFAETRGQYGGGQQQILALREMTGLSITQLEELRGAVEGMTGDEREKEVERILKEAIPVDEQLLEQAKHQAKLQNRLVEVGVQNKDAIISLQNTINTFISQFIPIASELLEKFSALLKAAVEEWGLDDKYLMGPKARAEYERKQEKKAVEQSLSSRQKYQEDTGTGPLSYRSIQDFWRGGGMDEGYEGIEKWQHIRGLGANGIKKLQAAVNKDPDLKARVEGAFRSANTDDDTKVIMELLELNRQMAESAQKTADAAAQTATAAAEAAEENNRGAAVKRPPPRNLAR